MATLAESTWWGPWLWLGVVLGAGVLLGLAVRGLICALGKRLTGRSHGQYDDVLVSALCGPASIAVPVLAAEAVLSYVPYSFALEALVRQILAIVLFVVIGWAAIALVRAGGQMLVLRTERRGHPSSRRSVTTRVRLLTRTVSIILAVLVGAVILMSIPAVRELGASMLASAGIAGIVAGLAARSILTNLMAGIQVAISEPIVIGDKVVIGGEFGTIEEISSSFVIVRVWDNRRIVIPIAFFLENRFENWTFHGRSELIGTIFVYCDYTAPVDRVRAAFMQFVQQSPLWDRRTAVLQVTECTDRAIQLRGLVSAGDADALWNLRCEIREKLVGLLQSELPGSLVRAREEQVSQRGLGLFRHEHDSPSLRNGDGAGGSASPATTSGEAG